MLIGLAKKDSDCIGLGVEIWAMKLPCKVNFAKLSPIIALHSNYDMKPGHAWYCRKAIR